MPLYESACPKSGCLMHDRPFEWLGKMDSADPECEVCHTQTVRQVSRFGVIWTGPITSKYLDRSLEGGEGDGGHWAYRRNTLSGKPEPVYIETFQQQREYCKSEGLGLPQDTDNVLIQGDGRTVRPVNKSEVKDYRDHVNNESKKQIAATAQETAA